ncbi:T9SS type A sorting domain-containing protein [bacterium]|nr:T9SS type A sorting domain-containing protein [bacterium]
MKNRLLSACVGFFLLLNGSVSGQSLVNILEPAGGILEQYRTYKIVFTTYQCAHYTYSLWVAPEWIQIVADKYIAGDGTYEEWWTVPGTLSLGSGRQIYAEIRSSSTTITSAYSRNFTIGKWLPSHIHVTYPNTGGIAWERGSQQTITWESFDDPISNVKIEIQKGTTYQLIAAVAPNTGSYTWTVPADQEIRSDCLIGITHSTNTDVYDYSDCQFAIVPASTLPKPDLVFGSFTCQPNILTEGQSASLRFTIRNSGSSQSGASHARLTVSMGNDLNRSDDYWVSEKKTVNALSSGSEMAVTWTLSSFPDLMSGNYNVWFVLEVDCDSEVAEGDESNIYKMDAPVYVRSVTAVEEDGHMPARFGLMQNFPNPFNPSTLIRFQTARSGHVKLRIFNVLGRMIRVLNDSEMAPGDHAIAWDGCDDQGITVGSGLYLAVLSQNGVYDRLKLIKAE